MTVINCPICRGPLEETLHEGVLIDTCPRCLGLWLDRGELDRLRAAWNADSNKSASPEVEQAISSQLTKRDSPFAALRKLIKPRRVQAAQMSLSSDELHDIDGDEYSRDIRRLRKNRKMNNLFNRSAK